MHGEISLVSRVQSGGNKSVIGLVLAQCVFQLANIIYQRAVFGHRF